MRLTTLGSGFATEHGIRPPGTLYSFAASLSLHASVATAILLFVRTTARPPLRIAPDARTIITFAGMPVPPAPARRASIVRASASPHAAARHRPLFDAKRRFAPPVPLNTKPAPGAPIEAPPTLTPQPQSSPAPLLAVPLLGPAPVQTGVFGEIPRARLVAPQTSLSVRQTASAGFSEIQSVRNDRSLFTAAAGSFDEASAGQASKPVPGPATNSSGFAEISSLPAHAPAARVPESQREGRGLEIQFKPAPVYTDEARRRRIEGEVLLEVLFTAGGEVRVIRVVRGLGYGLDEAAQNAASQIRFAPAKRGDAPVDSRAIVRIQFQLAY